MIRCCCVLVAVGLSCSQVEPGAVNAAAPDPAAAGFQAQRPRPQVVVAAPSQETPATPEPAQPVGEKPEAKAEGAPPAALPKEGEDAIDEQRARDEIAFENDYLRFKERLVPAQLGRWIAIVSGRVVPVDDKGKLAPAASMPDCLAAADAVDEKALHRFVFQIGEEGDVFYADASRSPRSVVGAAFKSTLGIVAGFDARSGEMTWTRAGKSRRFKFDHERFELAISDPTDRQSMATAVVDSSGYGGFLALEAASAVLLDGARFEIPGRVLLKTGDGVEALRRTRVRVKVGELDVDVTVPAAAWPR